MSIREAIRIYRRARQVQAHGFTKYQGGPEQICRKIIEDAYKNHGFFPVSCGHFSEFYCRDFSWIARHLVTLGYKKEVRQTLKYALGAFEKGGRVSVMITPKGKLYDFPTYAPDSLASLLLTLEWTENEDLINRNFFASEFENFAKKVLDGAIPKKGRFSSIRDHAKRLRSCYDMTMICVVARAAERLGFDFPLPYKDAKRTLLDKYWNGTFFFSDMHKQNIVVADANLFPFWTGIVDDTKMKRQVVDAIHASRLDTPFPLKYVDTLAKHSEKVSWHIASYFAPEYETDSTWAHLGLIYIEVLKDIDRKKAQEHIAQYTALLKRHRTFLEVYDRDGLPYISSWYATDEAMLWCAAYLNLMHSF